MIEISTNRPTLRELTIMDNIRLVLVYKTMLIVLRMLPRNTREGQSMIASILTMLEEQRDFLPEAKR